MAKHDRRKTSGHPPGSKPVTIQVPLPVLGVVNGVREAFHGLCVATGLQVLEAMMEADREVLCGPRGRHQVERAAWRAVHGPGEEAGMTLSPGSQAPRGAGKASPPAGGRYRPAEPGSPPGWPSGEGGCYPPRMPNISHVRSSTFAINENPRASSPVCPTRSPLRRVSDERGGAGSNHLRR